MAIAVTNKETMQMELSSKVRDLCQVCNWARTVTPATPIPINATAFSLLAAKPDHQVFSVSLRDIEQALKPKKCVDPATVLPPQYHEFLDIFSKDDANKLPSLHPGVDHKIKMEPGTQAPSGPLYGMSREELEGLKEYLTENLNKGFI